MKAPGLRNTPFFVASHAPHQVALLSQREPPLKVPSDELFLHTRLWVLSLLSSSLTSISSSSRLAAIARLARKQTPVVRGITPWTVDESDL